jgi:recombination protein RecA
MDIRKIQTIKKGDEVIGSRVKVKVVKNKVSPPFKIAEFTINSEGVDSLGSIVDMAIEKNIFDKSGAFIKYKNSVVGQGIEQAKLSLEKDPKLKDEVVKQVYESLKKDNSAQQATMKKEPAEIPMEE